MVFHHILATRMADCSLLPPPPFLALPGEPPVPWSRWLQSFEAYLVTAGLTEVSALRKKALLQHCLGAEGQRVLGTINADNDATYDEAVTLLNEHFAGPQSNYCVKMNPGYGLNRVRRLCIPLRLNLHHHQC